MSDQPPVLGPTLPVQWPPAPAEQPVLDERAQAARAEAAAVLTEANRMHQQAKAEAARITSAARREADSARAEAQRIRDEAQAAADVKAKRAARVDEWGPRVALAATIALTASGEFSLAQLAGWTAWIAWALPTAIDVYVVQAFRRHRDVPGAIILMVAANALYHLAERGLFGVATKGGEIVRNASGEPRPEWWLIVGVAAIAPWVMWRIHRITAPPKERQKRQAPAPVERQEVPAISAPQTPPVADDAPASSDRQNETSGAANNRQEQPAKKPAPVAKKTPPARRQQPAKKKAPRRSMDEWVELTEPIFHAEFRRLRRKPTASEFATAIDKAGHGKPGVSTAKNIRTEILDRAELPSLDGTQ